MNAIDIAWAAGVYEGEGSLVRDKRKRATYNLTIKMTDLDILQRFQSVFNLGSIRPVATPHQLSNPHWKPAWVYLVSNRPAISKILTAMLPYLGIRRGYSALNCLDVIDEL